jgi:hypothetical protein
MAVAGVVAGPLWDIHGQPPVFWPGHSSFSLVGLFMMRGALNNAPAE